MSGDVWSVTVGPHGAKVTAEERERGKNVWLKAYDSEVGTYRTRSLGFAVRDEDGTLIDEAVDRARAAAGELSNRRLQGSQPYESTELGEVTDAFRREVMPDLNDAYRNELDRAIDFWEAFLGRDFDMEEFGLREWNAARRKRGSGELDARGNRVPKKKRREVGPRTQKKTLRALRRICRFARDYRLRGADTLLDRDPTRGLDYPEEDDPNRPVMGDDRFEQMLEAAAEHRRRDGDEKVRSCIRELLIVVGETGRRISSVCALRWSDWSPNDASYGELRFRAEEDKINTEWVVPVTPAAREAIKTQRRRFPGVGEAPVFPAPASEGHLRQRVARRWWLEVEEIAELEHVRGMGFHSLRRRWASKRKQMSARDVAYYGGWKNTQTLTDLYQFPDRETLEDVAMGGRDLGAVEGGS